METAAKPDCKRKSKARPKVAALIPAHNEADTIQNVVLVARRSCYVDEVIVIDNASSDATASRAALAGARVIHEAELGKGQAMRTGVLNTDAEIILFLDADLLYMSTEHIDSLVEPMLRGDVEQVCGLFDRGPFINPIYLYLLPILTGQRAIRREMFLELGESATHGFRIEAAMNTLIRQRALQRIDFICPGLWQRSKEKKRGFLTGLTARLKMYGSVAFSYAMCAVTNQWMDRRPAFNMRHSAGSR